jgi:hypothetical protein
VGGSMNLSPVEILNRCEKMVNLDCNRPHSKHAIQIYLICSLFLGDIDDRMFKTFLAYYDRKFARSL